MTKRLLALGIGMLLITACGGGGGGSGSFCDAARALDEKFADLEEKQADLENFDDLPELLREVADDLRDLAGKADGQTADDLNFVADSSDESADLIEDAEGNPLEAGEPSFDPAEVEEATTRLDTVLEDDCGITIND